MKERKRNGKLILFTSFLIVRKNGDRQNWFPVSIIEQAEIMIHSFMKIPAVHSFVVLHEITPFLDSLISFR